MQRCCARAYRRTCNGWARCRATRNWRCRSDTWGWCLRTNCRDIDARLDALADAWAAHASTALPAPVAFAPSPSVAVPANLRGTRIAIARDAAFCFLYPANLDLLRQAGAQLRFFSPLAGDALPGCDAVWLPGGYPELHLQALSQRHDLHDALRAHRDAGKPLLAECGGMLFALDSLSDRDGMQAPMAGLLRGSAAMQPRTGRAGAAVGGTSRRNAARAYVPLRERDDRIARAGIGAQSQRRSEPRIRVPRRTHDRELRALLLPLQSRRRDGAAASMSTALAMLAGLGLDAALGEPRRAHPLVAFGRFAGAIERRMHRDRRSAGVLAWCVAVVPVVAIVAVASQLLSAWSAWASSAFAALLLYLAVGQRSLGEHARAVESALRAGDLDAARAAVGRMVSRDTGALDATQVAAAATESVLENGSDAVFAALFWFVLLGAPGVVLHRLSNTLDAMWGYRTPRFERFGWAAARIDDALNYVPARLTALTYAAVGSTACALRCWRRQAPQWDSPNAGPVMAAGAGALKVRLGGPAPYHGRWESRPALGEGAAADAGSIAAAMRLVRNGAWLWLALVFVAWIGAGALHA